MKKLLYVFVFVFMIQCNAFAKGSHVLAGVAGAAIGYAIANHNSNTATQSQVQGIYYPTPRQGYGMITCRSSEGATCYSGRASGIGYTIPQYVAKKGFKQYGTFQVIPCSKYSPICDTNFTTDYMIFIEVR